MMVNGNTWPFQTVEQRRYRFRFLNGCNSRFLILDFNSIPGVEVWQIGNEGGFLAAPVNVTAAGNRLLLVSRRACRRHRRLHERGARQPRSQQRRAGRAIRWRRPGDDFDVADPATTGQIMQFRVVPAVAPDPTTPPQDLAPPPVPPLAVETVTRRLALIEEMSRFFSDTPAETELGTIDGDPAAEGGTWRQARMEVARNRKPSDWGDRDLGTV